MWFLERCIVKQKELIIAQRDNVTFAQIIMLEKINLSVTLKIAQVVRATFIILTLKVF